MSVEKETLDSKMLKMENGGGAAEPVIVHTNSGFEFCFAGLSVDRLMFTRGKM